MNLRDFFPFKNPDGTPAIRSGQEQALALVESAIAAGKRYIIIEAPTGVGKSGIAEAVAQWAANLPTRVEQKGAYILSTQKSLTQQYMDDFGPRGRTPCDLREMKGRSNFQCAMNPGKDCHAGELLMCRDERSTIGDDGKAVEMVPCPYKESKRAFVVAPHGVTNFAYFLAETAYVGSLPSRTFLIIDECHNVEKEILNFAGFELTPQRCNALGVIEPPQVNGKKDYPTLTAWLHDPLLPALQRQVANIMMQAKMEQDPEEKVKLIDWARSLDVLQTRLSTFANGEMQDWVVYTDPTSKALTFKPFTAADIAQRMLFQKGQYILMMSATILDTGTFMRNLGIPERETAILKLDSEFPVDNRPVYAWYAGNMNRDSIDATLPKLCRKVEEILDAAPLMKGIIHTHSYKVTRAVMDHLRRTKHSSRIISHSSDRGSREAAILRHRESLAATILVSPSMYEGLDLKGNLSRVQIICKVPYPALDPYITARKDHDPQWYLLQTGLSLIQASGRSVRSVDDWAFTFVLDQGFHSFFRNNAYLLSPWWTKSVRVLKHEEIGPVFEALKDRAA